jgi:hypothetical protein
MLFVHCFFLSQEVRLCVCVFFLFFFFFFSFFFFFVAGIHPEELVAVANASVVPRTAGGNTIVWFNVFIPRDAVPGDHLSSISIAGTVIPLKLYVFNFSMPLAPKFHTQVF